jgi:hypothetical protein
MVPCTWSVLSGDEVDRMSLTLKLPLVSAILLQRTCGLLGVNVQVKRAL